METGTLPHWYPENQLEPHFTLLSLPALSKVPPLPCHHQEKEDGRPRWLGSDQQHRRCPGSRKYAALIFNAPFPFSPNKLSATAGRADLFCQQWKYFKYDACHWVTQNPSHTQKKHTLQKHPKEESSGLDLKDLRFQKVTQTA